MRRTRTLGAAGHRRRHLSARRPGVAERQRLGAPRRNRHLGRVRHRRAGRRQCRDVRRRRRRQLAAARAAVAARPGADSPRRVAAALAYSFIWDREIQGALAALGVTSIVVGLALQEPLGNLFSGLMLLMERPFEIGDSIEVGGVSGTVKEINWRSAHIEALGGMIQVVPNSTLNKETISNYSRPLPIRMEMLELAFSADDPPNQVRGRCSTWPGRPTGVIQSPKPIAATDRLRQPLGQLSPDLAGGRRGPVVGAQRSHHPHLVHDAAPRADHAVPGEREHPARHRRALPEGRAVAGRDPGANPAPAAGARGRKRRRPGARRSARAK